MTEETICAISTPIGSGGIGIIRISGKNAKDIANKVLEKEIKEIRKMELNKFVCEDFSDTVLSVFFKSPNSFTGEDIVEIHSHGGILVTQKILEELIKKGARLAENGEFSKRAFLNGKITLDKAEGIIDMINAESDAQLKSASNLMSGNLTKDIKQKQQVLTDILAEIEVIIDYPEHDIEFETLEKFKEKITKLKTEIENLEKTSKTGMLVKNGINVVLLGSPNVGKSSVMNALLNYNRAIVTNIAGTTRDTITESYVYSGIKVNLIDTAGIRENTTNEVELIGINLAKESINKADIILFIIDGTRELNEDEQEIIKKIENKKVIAVINKTDLKTKNFNLNFPQIKISAKNRTNVEELKKSIHDTVIHKNIFSNEILITNTRHKVALQNAIKSLTDALTTLTQTEQLELVSIDLFNAFSYLGEITGDTNKENIIDSIFTKFCLGK